MESSFTVIIKSPNKILDMKKVKANTRWEAIDKVFSLNKNKYPYISNYFTKKNKVK